MDAPKPSMDLWDFSTPDSAETCVDMCDRDIGGYSEARLDHVPRSPTNPAHMRFHGTISNRLPPNEPDVERTGYAAWRTQERPATVFGKALWDVDRYEYLAMNVKTDGRKYKINIQTESLVYTDIHQHRLYSKRPGQWETVLIKWRDFVRTNHGIVVEPQSEINKEQVRTIGVGLTDRLAGPFEMCISRIWATNGLTRDELQEASRSNAKYVPKEGKESSESPRHAQPVMAQKAMF